jgi:hypothetical protein
MFTREFFRWLEQANDSELNATLTKLYASLALLPTNLDPSIFKKTIKAVEEEIQARQGLTKKA